MFPSLPSLASNVGQIFKRSQRGLYHGAIKQFGNNVPHSLHKTRRTWTPNVQTKRLYSEAMGAHLRTRVTARALKTIDKYGGLDGYLMNTKIGNLGEAGMKMRERLIRVKERSLKSPAQ